MVSHVLWRWGNSTAADPMTNHWNTIVRWCYVKQLAQKYTEVMQCDVHTLKTISSVLKTKSKARSMVVVVAVFVVFVVAVVVQTQLHQILEFFLPQEYLQTGRQFFKSPDQTSSILERFSDICAVNQAYSLESGHFVVGFGGASIDFKIPI